MLPPSKEQRYTYADLLGLDDELRYELYNGIPLVLASPSVMHQRISGEIYLQLTNYLRGKKCRAYYAPLDVRLFEKEEERPEDVHFVVQPDLMVVCDPNRVDRHGIRGAPDLVIEIMSKSSRHLDRLLKCNLYQQAGVREYWLVDPDTRKVLVYTQEDGYRTAAAYNADASVRVGILDNCVIDLSAVFPAL